MNNDSLRFFRRRPGQIWLVLLPALICHACYEPSDYAPYTYVTKDKVILGASTQPIAGQLLANGQSVVRLFIRLNPEADLMASQVTFRTVLGTFVQNDSTEYAVTPIRVLGQNQNREAVTCWADLRAPLEAGTLRVTATVKGYAELFDIQFPRAFPDSIHINQGKTFALPPGYDEPLELTAGVFRNRGTLDKPSLNTKVTFSAFLVESDRTLGSRVGQFLPTDGTNGVAYSDSKATAAVAFAPGPVESKKTIAIVAQTTGKRPVRDIKGKIIYTDTTFKDTVYYVIK